VKESIRKKALDLGFSDCRFTSAAAPESAARFREWLDDSRHGELAWIERNAHKRVDPQAVLPGAQSVICLASAYSDQPPVSPPADNRSDRTNGSGRVARYARAEDYHDVLKAPLQEFTAFVNGLLGEEPRSKKSLWYVDTGPILERDFAQRAGLGFVGKHTNLISHKAGNWIFLSEVLTTLELPPDDPAQNRCGKCSRCIDVCPTAAITAPFELDARKCISYLTIELKGSIPEQLRPAVGNRIYGCDDCLEVCPWNRFAQDSNAMRKSRRADLDAPDLLELLALSEEAFRKRFRGTPMFRTKRRGVLRNVCVALGNTADQTALPALERALSDAEPLIVEHASWAIAQIESRIAGENSPIEG
jgi:epoxyqueuosine reductase